ncbi:hypothetical protein Acr_18g0007160 [Actinidia rufa]|uniref:Uncharacterized protein n=1 Tax=Actinidia rufa TaxID=165716 RepID=A0A7J0G6Y5_9ERIC|nr:hypothetical protein Acr_18g0007160 [Actinidia rufa]
MHHLSLSKTAEARESALQILNAFGHGEGGLSNKEKIGFIVFLLEFFCVLHPSIGLNMDDLEAEEVVQPIFHVLTVTRFD